MQQIEWREQLAELSAAADTAADLEKFIVEIELEQVAYENLFEQAMITKDYAGVLPLISKMQFMSKLLIEAEQVEDQLLIG
jgi:DnaJ-domain-containing protein 1